MRIDETRPNVIVIDLTRWAHDGCRAIDKQLDQEFCIAMKIHQVLGSNAQSLPRGLCRARDRWRQSR
ncbi:MAG: hypothetical protein R3C56_12840 [Pirellulaceae bacterium]